jgi:hypothetical protein
VTAGTGRHEKATPASLRFHIQTCVYSERHRSDAIEQRHSFGIASVSVALSELSE